MSQKSLGKKSRQEGGVRQASFKPGHRGEGRWRGFRDKRNVLSQRRKESEPNWRGGTQKAGGGEGRTLDGSTRSIEGGSRSLENG